MAISDKHLIWVDCEMTGLDIKKDRILEIAAVITNNKLDIVAEGPVLAVFQPESALTQMDDWNQKQHTESGLLARVRASSITEQIAENQILEFVSQYVPAGSSPICGNSIHQDRRFLEVHMPKLEQFFHYRNLDVSTIKVLAERWAHYLIGGIVKYKRHLARDDIYDSIEELRFYRQHFFSFISDPINR